MVENHKIRYSRVRKGTRYFEPTPKMKKLGFEARTLGAEGTEARAEAWRLYEDWIGVRKGIMASPTRSYPINSVGWAWERYRRTDAWKAKAKVTRDKDWDWSWRWIEPVFGDVAPSSVEVEDIEELRAIVLGKKGAHTAHRVMKIWRAFWKVMAAMKLCERDADPSRIVRNAAPKGRAATWRPGDLARIAKRAWREQFYGLAALLAVSWDTQFSPGDCRKLTPAQRFRDARGDYFDTTRGKTGQIVLGTLSRRGTLVLDAYLKKLGIELHCDAPLFRNRSGKVYSSDTLGDDFRRIRKLVFPGDKRQILDIRRSGAVEALAGEVDPAALAAKMGNTIDHNRHLQETYLPKRTVTVRLADEARKRGRKALRENER